LSTQSIKLNIKTKNGAILGATKFVSQTHKNQIILISSAAGVRQKYYSKFAAFFASQGFVVYTFDYSDIGESNATIKALKNNTYSLKNWGDNDQAAMITYVKSEYPKASLTLITHSIGGQLIGLNPNYKLIDKIIMVASQSGYWKHFKGIQKIKMFLFWYLLIPAITPVYNYFPAKKMGLFENLPKNIAYEWAQWGRNKKYMMNFYDSKTYFYEAIKVPMLVLSFSKDKFAPKNTVDWMANQYKNVLLERLHHTPKKGQKHAKHFGFFKLAFKNDFWAQTLNWILTN